MNVLYNFGGRKSKVRSLDCSTVSGSLWYIDLDISYFTIGDFMAPQPLEHIDKLYHNLWNIQTLCVGHKRDWNHMTAASRELLSHVSYPTGFIDLLYTRKMQRQCPSCWRRMKRKENKNNVPGSYRQWRQCFSTSGSIVRVIVTWLCGC